MGRETKHDAEHFESIFTHIWHLKAGREIRVSYKWDRARNTVKFRDREFMVSDGNLLVIDLDDEWTASAKQLFVTIDGARKGDDIEAGIEHEVKIRHPVRSKISSANKPHQTQDKAVP